MKPLKKLSFAFLFLLGALFIESCTEEEAAEIQPRQEEESVVKESIEASAFENDEIAADVVPQFNYVAPGFAPIQTIDMTQFWSQFGFPERGTNYYTSGGPATPSTANWERFNPQSPYYQVWFGTYIVSNFSAAAEWDSPNLEISDVQASVARTLQLAAADQIVWLSGYLDPHPNATIDQSSVKVFKAGPRKFSIYAKINTDSDLGYPDPLFGFYPGWTKYATLVEPNAPVSLDAVMTISYDDAHQNFIVQYASNCHWTLSNGTKKRTPLWVEAHQAAMMVATTFP